eukprot:gene29229-36243_t
MSNVKDKQGKPALFVPLEESYFDVNSTADEGVTKPPASARSATSAISTATTDKVNSDTNSSTTATTTSSGPPPLMKPPTGPRRDVSTDLSKGGGGASTPDGTQKATIDVKLSNTNKHRRELSSGSIFSFMHGSSIPSGANSTECSRPGTPSTAQRGSDSPQSTTSSQPDKQGGEKRKSKRIFTKKNFNRLLGYENKGSLPITRPRGRSTSFGDLNSLATNSNDLFGSNDVCGVAEQTLKENT